MSYYPVKSKHNKSLGSQEKLKRKVPPHIVPMKQQCASLIDCVNKNHRGHKAWMSSAHLPLWEKIKYDIRWVFVSLLYLNDYSRSNFSTSWTFAQAWKMFYIARIGQNWPRLEISQDGLQIVFHAFAPIIWATNLWRISYVLKRNTNK